MLQAVAERLAATLEEPFSLARVGADTFAVAFASLPADIDAMAMLRQCIVEPLERPLAIASQTLHLNLHAGIAFYPGDGDAAEVLFAHAEAALGQAQISGKHHRYFDPTLNTRIAEKLPLEEELRQALATRQFVLRYQPKVSLRDGAIVSAEALLRWEHPTRGIDFPDSVHPAGGGNRAHRPAREWVLRTVCTQQAAWLTHGLRAVPVGVNLSAVQFRESRVLELVRDALADGRSGARLISNWN